MLLTTSSSIQLEPRLDKRHDLALFFTRRVGVGLRGSDFVNIRHSQPQRFTIHEQTQHTHRGQTKPTGRIENYEKSPRRRRREHGNTPQKPATPAKTVFQRPFFSRPRHVVFFSWQEQANYVPSGKKLAETHLAKQGNSQSLHSGPEANQTCVYRELIGRMMMVLDIA